MEDTRIDKRAGVKATSDRLWELISDLASWNDWNPVDKDVEGAIAYGGQLAMTETFPDMTERRAIGRVAEWQPYSRLVWTEKRGFLFATVRYLGIEELDKASCIITSGIRFVGLRGELYLDRHSSKIRRAQEAIVEGLKAAAETQDA
nr:SRPBCC domain-containing protein [uncultured Brevundimonas sp.]